MGQGIGSVFLSDFSCALRSPGHMKTAGNVVHIPASRGRGFSVFRGNYGLQPSSNTAHGNYTYPLPSRLTVEISYVDLLKYPDFGRHLADGLFNGLPDIDKCLKLGSSRSPIKSRAIECAW